MCDKALFLTISKTTVFGYTRPYIAKGLAREEAHERAAPAIVFRKATAAEAAQCGMPLPRISDAPRGGPADGRYTESRATPCAGCDVDPPDVRAWPAGGRGDGVALGRGGPARQVAGSRSVHRIILRAGETAGLPLLIHPHMLRHACGFYLANKRIDTRAIQQYLGHCNLQHTVHYTALTPYRFTQ